MPSDRDHFDMVLFPDDKQAMEAIRNSTHGTVTNAEAMRKALRLTAFILSQPDTSRVIVVDADNKAREIVIL